MIIEIRKAGFVNKGAELMLHSVIQKVKERYPDAKLVMAPSHSKASHPFDKLTELGMFPKAWLWKYGFQWGDLASILPKKLREMYGLVLDKEVDIVLDAAGFSYSDQWGGASSKELARSSKRWRKKGTKFILLPQALGPYNSQLIKKHVKTWAKNADLIFPREVDSYKHLTSVVGEQDKIKVYPDFTNLIKGKLPHEYNSKDKRVALIPNYRMIDKTGKEESLAYLDFMIRCAKYLVEKQAKPFILVHDGGKDGDLADKISEATGGIPVVVEANPLHIKGILGSCDATIGSRFHGLVSALSQGVPSLATGWSHKYLRLFEDYNFSNGIISVLDSDEKIREKIDFIIEPSSAEKIRNQLNDRAIDLKKLTDEMWDRVFEEIDNSVIS